MKGSAAYSSENIPRMAWRRLVAMNDHTRDKRSIATTYEAQSPFLSPTILYLQIQRRERFRISCQHEARSRSNVLQVQQQRPGQSQHNNSVLGTTVSAMLEGLNFSVSNHDQWQMTYCGQTLLLDKCHCLYVAHQCTCGSRGEVLILTANLECLRG